jgi:hypothetical protein
MVYLAVLMQSSYAFSGKEKDVDSLLLLSSLESKVFGSR